MSPSVVILPSTFKVPEPVMLPWICTSSVNSKRAGERFQYNFSLRVPPKRISTSVVESPSSTVWKDSVFTSKVGFQAEVAASTLSTCIVTKETTSPAMSRILSRLLYVFGLFIKVWRVGIFFGTSTQYTENGRFVHSINLDKM